MSILGKLFGRRTSTKMESVAETTTTAPEGATTEAPAAAVVAVEVEKSAAESATTTTATSTTADTAPSVVPPANVTNGGPSSRFQFGAKAKMFRDMFAQHKLKLDADQTQLLFIICMSALAILCSFGAMGTNHWQCGNDQCYGLWNTCQKQTVLVPPEMIMDNETNTDNMTTTVNIMCTHHNAQNQIEMLVAEQFRIDQIQASQGLIICGTIMYVMSLGALAMSYQFIKTKSLNAMRNALVTAMFVQIISFILQLIGFFLYILTERLSTSVGLLFVYFGLALFATNVINFITIEYKSYKMRQVQI